MSERIEDMLKEEIKYIIEDLRNLETGSEEKDAAINELVNLYKLKIEDSKLELENSDRQENRTMLDKQADEQLIEQRKGQYFKLGVDVAGIVLPLIFYATWMRRGFKFEEKGTFTSTTFRGLFNRFRPTK